jgi:putative transposase
MTEASPLNKVNCQFTATRHCQLWVADIAWVTASSGFAYVEFVMHVSHRKTVGWPVSSRLRTAVLLLQPITMAALNGSVDLGGVIQHSEEGGGTSLFLACIDRIVGLGGTSSVGS